jgi:membrane protein YdbS with pleckstrin-like domain
VVRGTRTRPAGTRWRSLLVWVVYALGIVAALVLVASALFAAGGYFGSDDTVVSVSPVAVAVWGGLVAIAAATWLWRRREARR